MPAAAKTARAASTLGLWPASGGSQGANTSNDPNRRVRLATAASRTGRSQMSAARSLRASTTAAAPSLGEQSMYWVSGGLMTRARMISSSLSALRRQASGLSSPHRNALAATCASSRSLSPWACRYRRSFMAKNCVVTISPVSAYQSAWP